MRTRGNFIVLGVPGVISLWFISGYALKYLTTDAGQYGIYWPRHDWLYAHVAAGIVALMLGPLQLWLGLNKRTAILHRILGVLYVLSVAVGGTAAFYLAAHTDFGWVFGVGFGSMAFTWMVATALATLAICFRQVEQHREWMIRSYVLTFGFVTFRLLDSILEIAKTGSMVDRMTGAVWLSWTVPIVITECVLQARKIFVRRVSATPFQGAEVCTAEPAPVAFDLQSSESTYLHHR